MYDNSNILFEELFNEHYSQLYIHALGWIDNEESAKDIVNDVFCYLWEHLPNYDLSDNILPLLYRLIRNRSIDYIRHKNAQDNYISYCLSDNEKFDNDPYDYEDYESRINRVMDEINKLPAQTRKVFVETVLHHKSYKEVADLLGIQPMTVKTLVSRAYKILRKNTHFLLLFLYSF